MSNGIYKQVSYKKEVTFGVLPSAASAQSVRRVSSSLAMTKDTYQSNEIRQDFQLADDNHGQRKVGGGIDGELSAATYADFTAALLKKDFAATAAITGLSVTIGGSAGAWTITRAAGSFLTDGVKIGDVVRLTAGSFSAANLNKNIHVTNVTALVLTGAVINASLLIAEGPIAAATVTVPGKKSLIPQTGHTNDSFAIEHWYPDVPTSEVYVGCKPSKMSIGLPATGMATCKFEFTGKDVSPPTTTQYFTAPTAATSTGTMAAINGVLRIGGSTMQNVTGLTIDISTAQTGEPTIGANTVSSLESGRVLVTGSITATFANTVLRDAFYNETEISLYAVFTADNSAASDFMAYSLSRIKVSDASRDDGEKSLTVTAPFKALLNKAGGAALASDMTTISIQDSAA